MEITRRTALRTGGFGALAAAGLIVPLSQAGPATGKSASRLNNLNFPRPYAAPFVRPPLLRPYDTGEDGSGPFARYSLTAMVANAQIVPGLATPIAGYNGIFPGPTIRVERGVRTELRVRNRLVTNPLHGGPFDISTHLHGSASLPQYDGYANDITTPGALKTYRYPNSQHARSLWYHDHTVHVTGQNVYAGLAANYFVSDPAERRQLPQGEFDVPLTISDAIFADDGRLAYDDGEDGEHDGLWGDVILVNGVPWPKMQVKPRVYRFRVLNASIARSYRPRLSDQSPMTIVATDGGLMPVAQTVTSWRHGAAERYEVLIDFRRYAVGQKINLINLSNKNNDMFDHTRKIMQFEVVPDTGATPDEYVIPTTLDRGAMYGQHDVMALTPAMAVKKRYLRVHKQGVAPERWVLNDRSWADVEASGFQEVFANVAPNTVELWEIENKGGGWFHPMHLHLVDFKVIWRNTNGKKPFAWEMGPKDTVYVGEGEKVRLLIPFDLSGGNQGGRYMIHCHNLPHEDHDMMIQYAVGDPGVNDPFSDPCVHDDLEDDRPEYDDDGGRDDGGSGGGGSDDPVPEPTSTDSP